MLARVTGATRRVAVPARAACVHTSTVVRSASNPGPVETTLKKEAGAWAPPPSIDASVLKPGQKQYSAKIKNLVDQMANLTLLELMDYTDLMKEKLGMTDRDLLFPAGFGGGGAPAAAAAPAAEAAPAAAAPAPKEEKTHVDLKLKAYDQKNKIKVIKEVRAVTGLGLKEAKDLVEGVPATLMEKVKRADAAAIVEKLKAECGAEVEMV